MRFTRPRTPTRVFRRFPHASVPYTLIRKSRLISWDLAIDENAQPLLIEGNLTFGELDFHQMCNGPIFGDLTEEVLKDVFANSYTLNSILKSF